jgi:regulation of enolase protein 1 (concanavalin A-like superfamily)
MFRCYASLLSVLVVGLLSAAPAPFPAPSEAWEAGWDKPVGDGKFERKGDRLTMTILGGPGGSIDGLPPLPSTLPGGGNTCYLLREIEGDFLVEVRVGGAFRPKAGLQRAGLLLTDGKSKVRLECGAGREVVNGLTLEFPSLCIETPVSGGVARSFRDGPPLEKAVHLRIARRSDTLTMEYRAAGKEWTRIGEVQVELPQKVKVGVVAESTAGVFRPVFDQFKLTK